MALLESFSPQKAQFVLSFLLIKKIIGSLLKFKVGERDAIISGMIIWPCSSRTTLYDSASSMQSKESLVCYTKVYGYGLQLDMRTWLKFKAVCMKLHSIVKIQLFGLLPKLVNLHVQKHGKRSEENCFKIIGGSYSGLTELFLNILLLVGLLGNRLYRRYWWVLSTSVPCAWFIIETTFYLNAPLLSSIWKNILSEGLIKRYTHRNWLMSSSIRQNSLKCKSDFLRSNRTQLFVCRDHWSIRVKLFDLIGTFFFFFFPSMKQLGRFYKGKNDKFWRGGCRHSHRGNTTAAVQTSVFFYCLPSFN